MVWDLDKVSIPGTSITVTTSDLGVICSLALIITGFWLMANLKSEKEALLRFLGAKRKDAGQWDFNEHKDSNFTDVEIKSAYEPIANTFVFASPKRNIVIDALDTMTFLAPIAIIWGTFLFDAYDLVNKGLQGFHTVRLVISSFLALLVAFVWLYCTVENSNTRTILRLWYDENNKKNTSGVDESSKRSDANLPAGD